MKVTLTDFLPEERGDRDATAAFQRALLTLREAGGGELVVPPGRFVTGLVETFSNITIRLERDALWSSRLSLEGRERGQAIGGLLFARDAENVALIGEGTVDGGAEAYFLPDSLHGSGAELQVENTIQARQGRPFGSDSSVHGPWIPKPRPGNMLVFARCKNVEVAGLQIKGSPYWTLHIADSAGVRLHHLKIANDRRHPNNDGIHVTTSQDVHIAQCTIVAGDDAIAITGIASARNGPWIEKEIALGFSELRGVCRDVRIEDCVLSSRSSAIRLGYGVNPVRNVSIRGCEIRESNRGIFVQATESEVSAISVERCEIQTQLFHGTWWGCGEPISIAAVRFPESQTWGRAYDIRFHDVTYHSSAGASVFAEKEGLIESVSFSACSWRPRQDPLYLNRGGNVDLRPCADPALSLRAAGEGPVFSHLVKGLAADVTQLKPLFSD